MVRVKKKCHQSSKGVDGDREVFSSAVNAASVMLASTYALHCSVCENNYDSRTEWLSHLGTPEHQTLARIECSRTWAEDKEMKECVAAVYCSFPLTDPGNAEDLLERFSSTGVDFLVTDFVWWPGKPRLGFLQFESRKKVKQVWKTLQGPNGYVREKLVQMKKGVDILELEWKDLLPSNFAVEEIAREIVPNNQPPPIIPFPSSSFIPTPVTPLQCQFNSICQSVEIPEHGFKLKIALQIANKMEQAFKKLHPSGQLLMLRNYYLRLRNNGDGDKQLILFAYLPDSPSFPYPYQLNRAQEKAILVEFFRLHPDLTRFQLKLVTDPDTILEAQLCLLLQYLCTFDPRVKPVLTLVHFWARSHNVRIAQENISESEMHSNLPEPVALEWMVILFLIRRGILPSVREILQRPHEPLVVTGDKIDIGFSSDPEHVREWRKLRPPSEKNDDSLISVILLVYNLFRFYGNKLQQRCWILNPKDGEIIETERNGRFLNKTKLTPEELRRLGNPDTLSDRIYMVHPLNVQWRLSFCVETWNKLTCRKMMITEEALGGYLKGLSLTKEGPSLVSVLGGARDNGK